METGFNKYSSLKTPYGTLTDKLTRALEKKYGDKFLSLIIFGSVARGKGRKDSDVDSLLIIDSLPRGAMAKQREFTEVEKEIEGYLNMAEDAIVVYDKDDFFKNILEKIRKGLKDLESKRVRLGSRWYWVLKPDYRFKEVTRIG